MTLLPNKQIVCPFLIGREADLAALQELVEQAKRGEGKVALIGGEAGIGKSRLVEETKTYADGQGFVLLQGNCFQADSALPYATFLDVLHSSISGSSPLVRHGELTPFAQELLQLLPDVSSLVPERPPRLLQSSLNPQQEQRRLFANLLQFFTEQATRQPMLIVIEDLHWSDETSLELLLYLARRCTHLSILFVLTYRSEEVSPELRHCLAEFDREHLAHDFTLQRLNRTEVDEMLRTIFAMHGAVHTGLLDSMFALTEGNPFFIEEMLKSLIATGEITNREGVWERSLLFGTHTRHPSIPRSVQDAIYLRIKQLSATARHVLTLAAVAGRRFDLSILQQVMRTDELHMLACMKELVAAQLVLEEAADRFSFRHALTRQAVYAELLAGERRALHRHIAETIEQGVSLSSILDAHLVDLASHFYEGEVWSKAVEYGQRAGERSLILYAPRAAIEHLTRALGALSHLDSTPPATVLRARGQAYETIGEFERARSDYERVLEIAQQTQDGIMEWQGLLDLGFLWVERDYAQAGEWFQKSLDLAQVLADPKLLARSLNRVGNWLVNTGRAEEALQTHQEALAIFETLQDQEGMAETFDLLGMANGIYGDTVQAVEQYDRAITSLRTLGDRQGLISSLTTRVAYASPTMVETTYSVSESPERRVAWSWGELSLARDEAAVALDIAERLLASVPGATSGQPIPWLLKLKGEALGALSRREEALEALEEARRGALARQEQPLLWQIHRALGREHRRLRQEDLARHNFTAAREGIASLASSIDDGYLREHFLHAALSTLPREKPASANRTAKQAFGGLTEREREVVRLVAQGKSNREIADALVVTKRTIETHINNIQYKLNLASRAQLVVWAVEKGLATHEPGSSV